MEVNPTAIKDNLQKAAQRAAIVRQAARDNSTTTPAPAPTPPTPPGGKR